MQRIIAKFGLAAHLAILAVAPLFLFPFCRDAVVAVVLLWLSLFSGLWVLLEPSVRGGEHVHGARRRVAGAMARDPLFWVSLVAVIFTGLRAYNSGIALAYDAEKSVWYVSSAVFRYLPGSVGDAGFLPFATALAVLVLLQGCRHALGRSARMSFLLILSSLAGLAAVIALIAVACEHAGALAAVETSNALHVFVGFSFGLCLLVGMVALAAAFENHWYALMPAFPLAIGGTAAGLFAFAPISILLPLFAVALVMMTYVFVYAGNVLRAEGEFKLLVVAGLSLVVGGLLAALCLPDEALSARFSSIIGFNFFADRFWEFRTALSDLAIRTMKANLWIGSGLASFPLEFRFNASPEDWALLPGGALSVANGWWQILVERGLVGIVFIVLPFAFLMFTYGSRLAVWTQVRNMPHPACVMGPLALGAFIASGFIGNSMMRPESVMAVCSMMAVAAAAFPRKKRDDNGR